MKEGKKMKVAVYDAKEYDREFLTGASGADRIVWSFFDFHLSEDTKESAKGHDAICVFVNDQVDTICLESFAQYGIKLIVLRCTGFNNVAIEKAHQLGISVTRVPAYSPHAVAEHAVGLLLCLNRKIHHASIRVRELNFSLNGLLGFDVYNKTVGVIGTGNIGKVFAQIMKGFGTHVLAYDVEPAPQWAKQEGVSYVPLEELLEKSDIISLHVPLLPATYRLIDEKTLQKMKKGVYLINTSRGKVIETTALIQALKSGHIGGAALDTYEEEEGIFFEDLSDKILLDDELSRLLSFPNVLITSHQGFFTREALCEIARVTVENLLRFEIKSPFLEGTQL